MQQDDQQSRHESDTSSLADEKEIHNKLSQIMNLIGNESDRDEDGTDIVRSEEEFSRKMAEEVYDESIDGGRSEDDDLDLYQIQAEEVEDEGLDIEAEMRNLQLEFFLNEEEESKEEEGSSDEDR